MVYNYSHKSFQVLPKSPDLLSECFKNLNLTRNVFDNSSKSQEMVHEIKRAYQSFLVLGDSRLSELGICKDSAQHLDTQIVSISDKASWGRAWCWYRQLGASSKLKINTMLVVLGALAPCLQYCLSDTSSRC